MPHWPLPHWPLPHWSLPHEGQLKPRVLKCQRSSATLHWNKTERSRGRPCCRLLQLPEVHVPSWALARFKGVGRICRRRPGVSWKPRPATLGRFRTVRGLSLRDDRPRRLSATPVGSPPGAACPHFSFSPRLWTDGDAAYFRSVLGPRVLP